MFDTLRDNSRIIVYLVVIAFVISGGFMGYGAYLNNSGGGQQTSNPNVIAEVNGEEISQQEYLSMLQQQAPQSNLNGTQIISFRYNILNALIERKLILQQAEEMDINVEVSDQEVEDSYQNILEQNDITEEQLSENLAQQGYTMGALRDDIRSSLERTKTITQTIEAARGDISVSESEVRDLYNQRYPKPDNTTQTENAEDAEAGSSTENEETAAKNAENNSDAAEQESETPEFADVRDDLEQQLIQQKRSEALNQWLQDLKAESEIVINDPVLNAYHDYDSGNYEEAAQEFTALLEEESSPVFYTYLARSYAEADNTVKAEETYNTAVEEYPENTDLRFNYAQFLSDQDKSDAAVEQLTKVSELAGDDFMTRYQLYMMYMQLGADQKAEAELEEIKRLSEEMNNQQNAEENNSTSVEGNVEDNPAGDAEVLPDETLDEPLEDISDQTE